MPGRREQTGADAAAIARYLHISPLMPLISTIWSRESNPVSENSSHSRIPVLRKTCSSFSTPTLEQGKEAHKNRFSRRQYTDTRFGGVQSRGPGASRQITLLVSLWIFSSIQGHLYSRLPHCTAISLRNVFPRYRSHQLPGRRHGMTDFGAPPTQHSSR